MLPVGTRLGPYEIIAPLGAGGMGEVYRARDTKLDRAVAIKILPESFAQDPERLARFEREAKTLAALNHPNIAIIHGFEEADGIQALVMELVEGPTLAERITHGPLSLDEALVIANQIADALEAAHDRGIIHRDLKPANINLRPDGTVKVLDFGLAKALEPATAEGADATASPTITSPAMMTGVGVLLGTAAYMSPEQAKGRPADKRSDNWAFGCVLYEMLTGKRAFAGEDVADTLAAVLRADPDCRALPTDTPAQIALLLRRCLQKDPRKRLPHIGVARLELEELQTEAGRAATVPPVPAVHRWEWGWLAAGLSGLLLIALAIPAFLYFRRPPDADEMRFLVSVPTMLNPTALTVSPDGRWIAFVAQPSAGRSALFVRSIDSVTPRQLDGTEGSQAIGQPEAGPIGRHFWSADSRSIAFVAGAKLKRVDLAGGPPQILCDVPSPGFLGGTWNNDGVLIFGTTAGLYRVSATGGKPDAITTLDASQYETGHAEPFFLPDGRHYLYSTMSQQGSSAIYVGSLDSSDRVRLFAADSKAVFAEPGYLLFHREGTLFAQPFDTDRLRLTEQPVRIADQVPYVAGNLQAGFAVSQTGVLVHRTGSAFATTSQFQWFDRAGKLLGSAGDPGVYAPYFDVSPDGKLIAAIERQAANSAGDVWIIDWVRPGRTRFTFDSPVTPDGARDVVWSPDGLRLAFSSFKNGNRDVVVKNASGLGDETLLLETPNREVLEDWSDDGRYIVYGLDSGASSTPAQDLYALPLFGDRRPFPIIQSPFQENEAQFSFDGKWLAYSSNESGRFQVYVLSFPALDQRRQISTNGGSQPQWRKDGSELYYLAPDGKLMAVNVTVGTKIELGPPRELFDTELTLSPLQDQYRVTPDGQRFLVLKPVSEATPTPITVIVNWTARLKK